MQMDEKRRRKELERIKDMEEDLRLENKVRRDQRELALRDAIERE